MRKSKVRVRFEPTPSSLGTQDRRPQDQSRQIMRKNVFLNFFRHEVVPVSRLQHRSSAPRSAANGRTTECVPTRRDMHHRGRIPFSNDRNTLWEVFVEKQSTAARRRQRDKQGDYFQEEEGAQPPRGKKIPGISVRSWKDILIPATATNWTGSQMTSLPALPQLRS